jgi:hypothetical protein
MKDKGREWKGQSGRFAGNSSDSADNIVYAKEMLI